VDLKLSDVLENNDSERIDSEYFQKKYLNLDKIISNTLPLKNISKVTDGDHSKFPENQKKEVRYLRSKDIKNYYLDNHDPIYVSSEYAEKQKRSYITEHNILISIMGNVGDITITPDNFKKSIANRAVAIIKNIQNINAYYLFGYLITKYAFLNIERLKIGGVQLRINLEVLEQLKIPTATKRFQKMIESVIKESHKKQEQSKTLYKQAENLLLEELGLLDYAPSKQSVSVKSFSQSFGSSGRLDSEYYLPKYEQIMRSITSTKHKKLSALVDICKSIEPGSDAYQDEGIPFVRVSNLTKFGLSNPDIHLSEDIADEETLESLKPKKDTILLSKDGTVGIAYTIKDETNVITSGAILHLYLKDDAIKPEYLTLVLNSMLVQMQSERDAGGSIIKHWKPSEISEVLIPVIDEDIQLQIESKIKDSFRLKKESQNLLDLAKRAVEVAIEEGEDVAMELMQA